MGNILQRLRRAIGMKRVKRRYHVNPHMAAYLENLALEQDRDPEQVAKEIMAEGIAKHMQSEQSIGIWECLSAREQEVLALVCLGYMNREIGEKLFISPETVKTYVSRLLRKLDVSNRVEIQHMLEDWDFSDWDR